jgi:hypothetical protein
MAIPKLLGAQIDFSHGELDTSVKRSENINKLGGRQMSNWRILASKAFQNRSGRSALFLAAGRTEELSMPGGAIFFINFGAASISVFNSAGAQVFTATTIHRIPTDAGFAIPWTALTVGGIVWAQIGKAIYIAYPDGAPNNVPQVLSFDGVSTWMLTPYLETVEYSGQKRTPFYRISPPNTTLLPSATTGNINITFSTAILNPSMVGTRLEFCGRQLTITSVTNATTGTATVNEPLPPGETLNYTTLNGQINIGDVVIGSVTGATGIVTTSTFSQTLLFARSFGYVNPASGIGDTLTGGTSTTTGIVTGSSYYFDGSTYRIWNTVSVTGGTGFINGENVTGSNGTFANNGVTTSSTTTITVQLIPVGSSDNVIQFSGSENVVGPSGSFALTGHSIVAPQAVAIWDDEVMNAFRGYPASVFADQSRLGFTNFPSVPAGLAWSAIGLPYDLLVAALPDNAIFELAPDNSQVFYVVAGMESSEFVFTDRAVYHIPISAAIPLAPGNVAFNKLSDYGCFPNVQPRRAEQSIIYIKAGGTMIGAVQTPGAYYRPHIVDNISELHSHLFTNLNPIAIAIPSGPAQFEETYIYITERFGSVVVGRYAMRQGLIEPGPEGKPAIGWLPWSGAGSVEWVAARQSDVIFTSQYGGVSVVERLDETQYLDGAVFVNNLPPALTPPGGKGPLWNFPGPNTTVTLIDLGTRFMDTYAVDANGFIIPRFIGGENLASLQLVAGQPWTAIFEPFTPEAPPGQSQHQRMLKRRVSYLAVRVTNSTGFVMARLFAGPITPSSPALGTIINQRRVPAYNQGEDPTQAAPQREEARRWRPVGRAFDPRIAVIKDTPGPLMINEIGMEVTI